ncbi:MAG: hypothetical protein HY203_05880 [Nitrospirae bacterium]|nr:hypothetical protein [Nitrospirota bacterium]
MNVDSNAKEILLDSDALSAQDLQKQVQKLQSQILSLQKSVEALETKLLKTSARYVAACPNCQTRFDMLAHHYSIGLFDNLVYVKCPKCHKTLPLKGGSGGDVDLVQG